MVTPVPRECCGGFCETPILAGSRFFGVGLSLESPGDVDEHG